VTTKVTNIISKRGNPIFSFKFCAGFFISNESLRLFNLNAKKKLSDETLTFIKKCIIKTKNILHLPPRRGLANAK
jgi:hypothetical protein